jgi:allantoinase
MIEHRHKVTPYRGEEFYGVVKATWLRGEVVFKDGKHKEEARGKWLS